MIDYLKAQTETNSLITSNHIKNDDLTRMAKSDLRWAKNYASSLRNRPVHQGEVYQFEFGKNYLPEMSYEHRGLVIGVRNKLLYVLPIFSYKPNTHKGIYDPCTNPTGDLYLLRNSEWSFLKRDSVLKLNDIRTLSVNRIMYQQRNNGIINPQCDAYKEIKHLAFIKYFPEYAHDFSVVNEELKKLKEEHSHLLEKYNELIINANMDI